ncbi:discoidin domain-containing protein [Reichenbachiella sp. MALMAid0571]|uniref:discoidin domain-containing protein n=1 Tax=Reichenbachiella sp. MALMAid0571 TaxID=3143939 RepID=UPI0032E01418
MKNIINSKYIAIWFAAIGMLLFQSCEEEEAFDVEGTATNKVYINTPFWSPINLPKNSAVFKVINTPAGSVLSNSDKLEIKLAAQCTHSAERDIKVTFEKDNSLILEGYSPLPEAVTLNMNTNQLMISQGTVQSNDSLTISISSEDLQFLDVNSYMVPVRISSVENAEISSNLNIVYLVINTEETNVYTKPTSGDMEGDLIDDRSEWSATLDIPISSGSLSNIFNTSTRNYWFVNPATECTLTVDLAAEYSNISGIRIHSYSTSYSLNSIMVSTSVNGEDWTSQGTAELSTSSSYQYIKFYSPLSARYIKLHIVGWSSSFVIMSRFDVYELE